MVRPFVKNIAVFASGRGSNFSAIVRAVKNKRLKLKIRALICDKKRAPVLAKAKKSGVKCFLVQREDFDLKSDFEKFIIKILKKHKVDFIVLAGFMRILGPDLIRAYKNKIINIHPALLPFFKGAHAIKDAFDAGVDETGVTVHFVDRQVDHGPIILQEAVKIQKADTLKSLESRIHKIEHRLYPEVLKLFTEGKIVIKNGKAFII